MNRDALLWTAKPPPPRQPKPGEHLWSLSNGQRRLDCELRDDGELGVEAQLLKNGEFYGGRRFDRREQAIAYAQRIRTDLEEAGWR